MGKRAKRPTPKEASQTQGCGSTAVVKEQSTVDGGDKEFDGQNGDEGCLAGSVNISWNNIII